MCVKFLRVSNRGQGNYETLGYIWRDRLTSAAGLAQRRDRKPAILSMRVHWKHARCYLIPFSSHAIRIFVLRNPLL